MLIIVDKKISFQAQKKLSEYGELLLLETNNIVYPAISGHADIFFCNADNEVIIAPNLPKSYFEILYNHNISFLIGSSDLQTEYPFTAYYNAVVTKDFIIHNKSISDVSILQMFPKKEYLQVKQGYTRCNLIYLGNNTYITSDIGINKVLANKSFECLYINPQQIILEGYGNGFFGGCCGLLGNKLFINGSIKYLRESSRIKKLAEQFGIEIIELSNSNLIDIGSILFIQQ